MMAWTNLATLQAKLDPAYQGKMLFLREKLMVEAHVEQQRHYNQQEIEHIRSANQEAADRRRLDIDRTLQDDRHYHKMLEMQADLQKSLVMADVAYQQSVLAGIDQIQRSVVDSIARTLEQQQTVYGDIVKMYAQAKFGEVKAQADHGRQLDAMRAQQELNLGEKLFSTLMEAVDKFYEAGKEAEGKAAIDRAFADAVARGL